ncbi:MAG: nuclear transport factor 2 family protein [Ignavibacteria bacterium]|nr:nuclear transport factor 2 family protein [Ignavibacteria bacterium]
MKTEFEAFQKKDPSLWIKYVDGNAIFTGSDNTFKTKDQIIEEMKSAPDIFISAAETYDDIITRTYGNTTVLSCLTTFTFISSDGNINKIKFKFTRVHIKDGTEWKLVYHSSIPVEI